MHDSNQTKNYKKKKKKTILHTFTNFEKKKIKIKNKVTKSSRDPFASCAQARRRPMQGVLAARNPSHSFRLAKSRSASPNLTGFSSGTGGGGAAAFVNSQPSAGTGHRPAPRARKARDLRKPRRTPIRKQYTARQSGCRPLSPRPRPGSLRPPRSSFPSSAATR